MKTARSHTSVQDTHPSITTTIILTHRRIPIICADASNVAKTAGGNFDSLFVSSPISASEPSIFGGNLEKVRSYLEEPSDDSMTDHYIQEMNL